jgi:hypothetical protein
VQRVKVVIAAMAAVSVVGCDRAAQPAVVTPASTPPPVIVQVPRPSMNEQETMTALAAQGARALSGLNPQSDIHHGATWFQGTVPANGSTAYLYLGKLGDAGASTLRFVVRYEGRKPADLGLCNVVVDGVGMGSFSPAPNRADQPSDGSVRQIADIHFDDIRPIVLAMISGQTATIRTTDGAEIRLDRSELDEMRRVLSAYLHIQSSGAADSPPAP